MPFYDAIRIGSSAASDFEVERSLRFNDDDSAVLTRTPSGAGNRKTYTISAWVKRCNIGGVHPIFARYTANNDAGFLGLYINSDDYIYFSGWSTVNLKSSRLYRDPTAWAHIVLAVDTTQSTSTDRIKLYFNGELQTTDSYNAFSQNADTGINEAVEHRVGNYNPSGGNFFDGYMAEINFLDGYAYDASYFGETNAETGQWIPKKYTGSYGTNGFYLNFSDNSGTTATTLGKDSSGNSNNFTPNNFSVSAGLGNDSFEDTPTNNFPTLNPNHAFLNGSSSTAENGNLQWNGQSNNQAGCPATMAFPKTGKWYWEVKLLSSNSNFSFGITPATYSNTTNPVNPTGAIGYAAYGSKAVSGVETPGWAASFSSSDNIGAALDMDNNEIKFYKNNSLVGTISLVSGYEDIEYLAWIKGDTATQLIQGAINFGGNGFVYTPPTGFQALNSANLPDPTILLPNKHFDTLLYTGNGGTQSITGLDYQPDWVWIKRRNGTNSHQVYDAVRGAGKNIRPDLTNAEVDQTAFNSFDSNGFELDGGTNSHNASGNTYVAWNWNAGNTDGKTYTVKVASPQNYQFDNFATNAVTLDLAEGGTYIFNMDDSSNASHPFSIGTAANGTVYTSGITYFLDGVSKTYSEYTSGFYSATTRRLHFTVPASAPVLYYWCSVHSGMGGQINTNSTLGSSNFDGAIQSTVKVNASAGFSIVKYTGTGSTTNIGHGLGVTPEVLIVKNREDNNGWNVYHIGNGGNTPAQNFVISLNSNAARIDQTSNWNDTAPTSSVFTVGTSNGSNGSNDDMIAYCFSEVAGYTKFGKYTGNGSTDGTFVFVGFRPAMIIIKNISTNQNWRIFDNKRSPFNTVDKPLTPDSNGAESTADDIDFVSNGFKHRSSGNKVNSGGKTYIFLAFAEAPFKNARAR